MTRPVGIAATALVCAAGSTPAAVAATLWAGAPMAGYRSIGDRIFPFYALAGGGSWRDRAAGIFAEIASQLGPLPAGLPLFFASSSYQMGAFEAAPAPLNLPLASGAFIGDVAAWLGLSGPCRGFANACISGFSALAAARALIAAGWLDDALVVGCELPNAATPAGFAALELLSPDACRPFDARRNGLVLGEAVAAVRLTAAPARWCLAGIATGLDAYSPTSPDPTGGPLAAVAVDALEQAKIAVTDLDVVKLQAAGSPGADLAEANALRRLFPDTLPPLLSFKAAFGHTLGASGIAELAALLACLDAGCLPPTAGFAESDPEIGLSPTREGRLLTARRALLNVVGFGGGVAAAVVERSA
ncbi:MAG: beta-ketoacyl synthase [Betaproteobacteria bacterium]|nr:beta-ketoacyl synthase [Betaproteobacteria bacterium]